MAPRSDNGTRGLRHAGDDAFQLTVDYLKQETVEPLKGLGRFLYMGIAGSFCLAGGILLILIGILRLLQTETGSALTGDWSWVPYAVVVLLGIGVIGVAAWRITAGPGQEKDWDTGGSDLMSGTTTTKSGSNGRLITREDLQAAYAQVMGEGEATARAAAPRGLAIAGAVGILVITLAFLAGRRRGRAKSAVVEIRRL